MGIDAKHEEDSAKTIIKEKENIMEKDAQQEQEKKNLEVKNETLDMTIRNYVIEQNNNKIKINELKGV